jgi:hypothetical protein
MALASSALTALALAGAQAPTLVSPSPCVSAATGSVLTGTGWTPNGQVRLTGHYVDDGSPALDHTVQADAEGRITFTSGVPNDDARRLRVRITAQDVARVELRASVDLTLSWFGPFFRPWNTDGPARGRPGKVSRIEASGYVGQSGRTLYAHYVLRDEHVATTRVGRLRGPCGALTRSFRQFAFRPVPRGTYSVFFDTRRRFADASFDAPGYRRVRVR